ncbi:hypothetical protein, partial [Kerstersia gyiorum]|uniref:hypothetical protein n=1 Tax=Kerstersia gyiorum TaxID=206506 RepID=UPI00209F4C56
FPHIEAPQGGKSGPQTKGRCPWRGFALPPHVRHVAGPRPSPLERLPLRFSVKGEPLTLPLR